MSQSLSNTGSDAGAGPGNGQAEGQQAPQTDIHLTPRELDILWGIAKGFTYQDIAHQLELSPKTIPTYIKSVYRKLEVNSRSEAVFEAVQLGLIDFSGKT